MRILAINTATEFLSVAVKSDEREYSLLKKYQINKHSQYILPLIRKILNRSDLSLKKLDAIAFSHGPGSFTGVRLGISIAKGLAIGANIPLVGISTFVTLAQGVWSNNIGASKVLTAINARMGEIYWAEYDRDNHGIWHGKKTEALLRPEIIIKKLEKFSKKCFIAGTGWKTYPEMMKEHFSLLQDGGMLYPLAKDMIPIAVQLLSVGKTIPAGKAEPIYFRNETFWKKSNINYRKICV